MPTAPSHFTPLLTLPNEILDMILDRLPMMMLPAFVVAAAPRLSGLALFPPIPAAELFAMKKFAAKGILPPTISSQTARSRLLMGNIAFNKFTALPLELWYLIGDHLALTDRVRFAIAVWAAMTPLWRRDDLVRQANGIKIGIV